MTKFKALNRKGQGYSGGSATVLHRLPFKSITDNP